MRDQTLKRAIWLASFFLGALILAACQSTAPAPIDTLAATSEPPTPSFTSTVTGTPTETLLPSTTLPPTETPLPSRTLTATPPTFVRENTPIPLYSRTITAENAGQLVELARLGKGRIIDVQLSPDRNYLIVQTTNGVYGYLADS